MKIISKHQKQNLITSELHLLRGVIILTNAFSSFKISYNYITVAITV